ncbi:MAG TPA: 16S rRNA (cytosine(967)-C(5))-methyltransferase RsmB [Moorella mulderi]|nr:16S rRNA (cytosine(967)-C(5))-methyltransferase RsmB [Moorella mulderi]
MRFESKVSAREIALQVIYRVMEEGAYANIALDEVLARHTLNKEDRALATELAYTTIKAWGTLDWALELYSRYPLKNLPPRIRCILRLGAAQLMLIPRIPPWAAIYESVELAKKYGHRGTASLVNAVLRKLDRDKGRLLYPDPQEDPAGYLALKYFHPRWLVEKWLSLFGFQETEALCQANNQPAPMVIRVNILKTSVSQLIALLEKEGARAEPARYAPEGLVVEGLGPLQDSPSFQQGLFYVQDEGSQLVAHALKPRPGSVVIDACAAPGGKSTHMAQLMGDEGTILACDIHFHRLELIRENCIRLGVNSVQPLLMDARELGKHYPEKADYLLVDAPCSGQGILRRRPDVRWRKELATTQELAELQFSILMGAKGALKKGGFMVYSTCSLAPEENQGVIQRFLKASPEFSLVSLEGLPNLPADLLEEARQGWVQYLPHRHGIDGFFIARLTKIPK